MKWVRMSIVLFVLVQLAGPWGWNDAGADEIIRQGIRIPYEITGPEDWIYRSEPSQYVLGVFMPEGDGMYPYISLVMMGGKFQTMKEEIHTRAVTPEQLVEGNLYLRPGARLLSSRWLGEEDSPYLLAEFTWSSVLGEIRAIKAFHPWSDMVLVVTAACLSTDYDELQPLFLDALSSVKVKTYRDPEKAPAAKKKTGGDDWLYDE